MAIVELPKMYSDLAPWWPLLSDPAEYVEEAAIYSSLLERYATGTVREVLELGSGGGNNATHMKAAFAMTLVDASPAMLAVSRRLNPDCTHYTGDMRTVRLGRSFDAVFVHDAVQYMTTLEDLRAAVTTAHVHLRPGGVALFTPDHVRENYQPGIDSGGHDAPDGRGLRFLEWSWDPDPNDTSFIVDYAYLLRDRDGTVHTVHDRHHEGIFDRTTWHTVLTDAGYSTVHALTDPPEVSWTPRDLFIAVA